MSTVSPNTATPWQIAATNNRMVHRTYHSHQFIFFSFFIHFLLIPCGKLSGLSVSFLLHIKYTVYTKTETRHWWDEAEANWHLGPYSSGHHRRSYWPLANMTACMCKGKGASLQTPVLWFRHTAVFRATSDTPKLVLFRVTIERERQHNFSGFV